MADMRYSPTPAPLRRGAREPLSTLGGPRPGAWRQSALFNTVGDAARRSNWPASSQGRASRHGPLQRLPGGHAYYPRVTRFEQISGDPAVVEGHCAACTATVDRVELFVGLFAEDVPPRSAVPPLIGRMVAADAFSHALTNPLLSPHVYNADTFTRAGMESIAATASLADLAARNLSGGTRGLRICMDHPAHASVA